MPLRASSWQRKAKSWVMNRHTLMSAALAAAVLTGCTTVGPSHAGFATPLAAAGVISFKPERPVAPNIQDVDAQVARLLDAQERAGPETLVAAR
jgi:hypothetical protein